MLKKLLPGFLPLCLLAALIGCSVAHTVRTDSTKAAAKAWKTDFPSIETINFTFTRPDLSIRMQLKEAPDQASLEAILAAVQAFSTVDRMRDIARSVNWSLEISEVHLTIAGGKGGSAFQHRYSARYYRTSDASNDAPENIDAYRTWSEER